MWAVDLSRVDIRGVQIDGATVTDTQLRRANLARSSPADANLAGAHLNGADLRRAELRGADLRGAGMWALHLCEAVLTGARTVWPADFHADERHRHGIVETSSWASDDPSHQQEASPSNSPTAYRAIRRPLAGYCRNGGV